MKHLENNSYQPRIKCLKKKTLDSLISLESGSMQADTDRRQKGVALRMAETQAETL